jgi:hypothetical protein
MNAKYLALAATLTGCFLDNNGSAKVSLRGDGNVDVEVCIPSMSHLCDPKADEQLTIEHDGTVTALEWQGDLNGHRVSMPAGSSAPYTISNGHDKAVITVPTQLDPMTNGVDYSPGSLVHVTWTAANQPMSWSYSYGCDAGSNTIDVGDGDGGTLPDSGATDFSVDTVLAAAQKNYSRTFPSCIATFNLLRKLDGEPGFLSSAEGVSGIDVVVQIK